MLIILYGECRQSAAVVTTEYVVWFSRHQHPSRNVILRLVTRARRTGELSVNRKRVGNVDRN